MKEEVEQQLPPWIAHNFSINLQKIANNQLQFQISVTFLSQIIHCRPSLLEWPLYSSDQMYDGLALQIFWFEVWMSHHAQKRLTPPLWELAALMEIEEHDFSLAQYIS
jgi:hypothetical protein